MDSGYRFEEVVSVEEAEPAAVYSIRVDSDDHSFLAGGFVNHNTECRLHPLAMQLLADIDEDTVDMVPNYDGSTEEPRRPAGAVPEPARQRQPGHRRRHGDEHPAAQPRRGHRRHDPPDRQPRRHVRRPDAVRQGPGLPDRRQHPRPGRHHRRLSHRPRQREDAGHGDHRGGQEGADRDRRHRAARTRRAARRSPRASRSSSTAATSTASPTSTTHRRAARPSSSSRSSATPTPTSCSTTCSS